MKNRESIWNVFPNYIFNSIGGIHFLLKCNFSVDKIPVKLAGYHRQALLAWNLIYKHNFSPHSYCIWNNKDILFKNKSLFYHTWFNEGIIWVKQLINSNGYLLSYTEFLDKFKIPVKPRDFAIVLDAISKTVVFLLRNSDLREINMEDFGERIYIGSINILKQNCSNNCIRNALCSVSFPTARFFGLLYLVIYTGKKHGKYTISFVSVIKLRRYLIKFCIEFILLNMF